MLFALSLLEFGLEIDSVYFMLRFAQNDYRFPYQYSCVLHN